MRVSNTCALRGSHVISMRLDISLDNVTNSFGTVAALRHVTLRIGSGDRGVVLGPSGSGMATLVRLLAGLGSASEGVVAVGLRRNATARELANEVAMVFQTLEVFPQITACQNIVL